MRCGRNLRKPVNESEKPVLVIVSATIIINVVLNAPSSHCFIVSSLTVCALSRSRVSWPITIGQRVIFHLLWQVDTSRIKPQCNTTQHGTTRCDASRRDSTRRVVTQHTDQGNMQRSDAYRNHKKRHAKRIEATFSKTTRHNAKQRDAKQSITSQRNV